ncbi:MAG TPA: Fic/DOC family N-terminal domain-containing protein [Acidothermaceae bacterium]|jgi:Fic family protein
MDLDKLRGSPIGRAVPIMVPRLGETEATVPYLAYVPDPLQASPQLSMASLDIATKAAMAVARLDQAVAQLPNPRLLIRPIIRREATSTSALEGTYAGFDEVLEADFLDDRQMSNEQREISNFVRATERAEVELKIRPISRQLIGQLQAIIVRGTPGETYDSGDLRKRQVYVGPKNRPVQEARFVPCPPGDQLVEGFSDWEKWVNAENQVPIIVKLALGHYQFETLHPYADGNGRLGRLIAILQLMECGALASPSLNVSPWFEARKDAYMDGLLRVTHTGDLDTWVSFFAEGIRAQAEEGVQIIQALVQYKDETLERLRKAGLRGVALQIAENVIGYPVIDVATARSMTDKTYEAANQAIARLVEQGVLREATGRPVNRLFVCDPVLRIINRR